MNCVEDFLKRNDRDYRRDHVLVVHAAEYRFRDRERHFLSGTDDLRAADNQTTTIHSREHFTNARVNFFQFDHVGLKRAVQSAVNRPERERDQVWVFL